MNKLLRTAGIILLAAVLVLMLAACGQRATDVQQAEEVHEIVVETPPASPTPSATPDPSVPPVAVTTVPMPMPSVSPTVSLTETPDPANPNASPVVSPSPSPSAAPAPTPTPYSRDAEFASTIQPDNYSVPDGAVNGYINANGVNFRNGPNSSSRIIRTLDSGTKVQILGAEGDWTEILVGGTTGYVKTAYVTRGNGTVIVGDDSSGIGTVIVPDGPVTSGNGTVVTPADDGNNFLGIQPD
ncbi:MAG: SH3 domain-containing protein [Oscillospiraceae bacterium]|nr:SH3 domain-containing protein [Oscillospiraceae bacterium]